MKVLREIDGLKDIELLMTDLYLNKEIVKRFNESVTAKISCLETPVDATDMGSVPKGLKTFINSFHHMRPEKARKILKFRS